MTIGNDKAPVQNPNDAPRIELKQRISKNFYQRFKSEHCLLMTQINGIDDGTDRERYASLVLTRIMCLYFLQHKGLLEDNTFTLIKRLELIREGNIPGDAALLDFSLFRQHAVERQNLTVEVADEALAHICAFFDDYQWQIDEDEAYAEHTITPVVLSYLFERYTNRKQTGAYYTRGDITAYMATFTIIPYLLEELEKCARIPGGFPWHVLRDNPRRYIYPALTHGNSLPLPEAITRGVSNIADRDGWDATAPAPFALPGETWREVITRRQRCKALLARLEAGELHTIDDLITESLDVRRFALDMIEHCQSINVLRTFQSILASMTILDPTCGTGAFLLAALNVLEPLSLACLERVEQLEANITPGNSAQVANRDYSVRRAIISANLYGVDIMEEAVELCRARLYLKLLASARQASEVQALPDIAQHIRAGNILIEGGEERSAFSAIIGNPPYIEYEQVNSRYQLEGYKTRSTGNLYAMTIERCTRLLQNGGRLGMIVPASATCTDGYSSLQHILRDHSTLYIASFSDQRGKLFDTPHPRLCILLYQKASEQSAIYTTTYMKPGSRSHSSFFQCLNYFNVSRQVVPAIIPRYGSRIEQSIHEKLYGQNRTVGDYVVKHSEHPLYHTRKLSWFVQVTPFIPTIFDEQGVRRLPSELKTLYFASATHKDIAFVALNSHLFYWFITTRSDGRNLNMRDIRGFPLSIEALPVSLQHVAGQLALELRNDLLAHAELRAMRFRKHGTLTIQCLFPGRSIVILDSIDRALAQVYAFSEEERDFLLHFDRKFRVSRTFHKI